jgi:hypothetical protein
MRPERAEAWKRLQALEKEYADLAKYAEDLERANERILKNDVEDRAQERFRRSPKNYLNVADERGTSFKSKPVQGGLAGLEKK